MAKTNCRKRRNKFATKSGKGREVWMGIFYMQILCVRVYTGRGLGRGKERRREEGGRGEDVGGAFGVGRMFGGWKMEMLSFEEERGNGEFFISLLALGGKVGM